MLAIFYGNDTVTVRQKALEFAETAGPADSVVLIEGEGFAPGQMAALASEVSLFGEPFTYVLDTPSARADFFEAVIAAGAQLQQSPHTFVVIEGALLAEPKKRLTKHADRAEEYKAAATERFNSFSLGDALAKRDRKLLWLLWHQALLEGITAEEIGGVLWWQLKTLRLAAIGPTAASVGLKDFPYRKAKGALSRFSAGELEALSRSLLAVLHESRLGRQDVSVSLERWILKV